MKKTILLLTTLISLSACSLLPTPYKSPVDQGNVIKTEQVKQLKIGMTESQVIYLLGSAMLINSFQPNEWHYLFSNLYPNQNSKTSEVKHLALTFKDGKLQNIQEQ